MSCVLIELSFDTTFRYIIILIVTDDTIMCNQRVMQYIVFTNILLYVTV